MSIIHADENNFRTSVANGTVLVDFYAEWCGPCKMIAPILEQLSKDLNDVQIVKVNVDEAHPVAEEFGIQSIPTLLLFKNGKVAAKTMGYQPKEILSAWIQKNK